jgi:thymidylate kinase
VDPLLYQQLNRGVRRPGLYIFLDLHPDLAAARRPGCGRDRWEQASIAARVPQAYQAALSLVRASESACVLRLDAAVPASELLDQALSAVLRLLAEAKGAADE